MSDTDAFQFDHWGTLARKGETLINNLVATGKRVVLIMHEQDGKEGDSGRYIAAAGKTRNYIPAIATHLFHCRAQARGKEMIYQIRTAPDSRYATIQTSAKGLEPVEDVTIDFKKPLVGQGLGALLKKGGVL